MIEIKIKGVKVAIVDNTIAFSHRVGEKSKANFTVKTPIDSQRFYKYSRAEIYQNNIKVFSGVIDTAHRYLSGNSRYHDIDCIDNHWFVEKRTITKAFIQEYAGDIVKYIVDNVLYLEGIWYDIDSIQLGSRINNSFNFRYCDDAMEDMCDKTGFVWWVDDDMKIYFQDPTATLNAIEITDEIIKFKSFNDIASNFLYRNSQYIKGPKGYTETLSEEVKYLGNSALVLTNNVGNIEKIEINKNGSYTEIDINLLSVKGDNPDAAFYYAKDDSVIAYNPWGLPLETRLAEGDWARFTYQGLIPLLVSVKDFAQIEFVKELENGGSGIVDNVDIDNDSEGYMATLEKANGKLRKYGNVDDREFNFQTYVLGFEPGEMNIVNSFQEGIIGEEVLVEEVAAVDVGSRFLFTIKCVKGAIHESWQRYFQKAFEKNITEIDDTNSITEILVVPLDFTKNWVANEVPNPFNIWLPSDSIYPSEDLYPSFNDDEIFNFIEIDYLIEGELKTERFKRSMQNQIPNGLNTIFYIPPYNCNGLLTTLRFYMGAPNIVGVTLDLTLNNINKNNQESFQIVRNDLKGW